MQKGKMVEWRGYLTLTLDRSEHCIKVHINENNSYF
jgi:hypothetical protein